MEPGFKNLVAPKAEGLRPDTIYFKRSTARFQQGNRCLRGVRELHQEKQKLKGTILRRDPN